MNNLLLNVNMRTNREFETYNAQLKVNTKKNQMKSVIEKYKKFIFIYVIINLIALMINVFEIQPYDTSNNPNIGNIYWLTSGSHRDTYDKVWPFVKFIEHHDLFKNYATHEYDNTGFNGIFYQYDISEFLLYIGILIAFLIYKAYISEPEKVIVKK